MYIANTLHSTAEFYFTYMKIAVHWFANVTFFYLIIILKINDKNLTIEAPSQELKKKIIQAWNYSMTGKVNE